MTKIYFSQRTKEFTRKVYKSLLDVAFLDEDKRGSISCEWITNKTIKFDRISKGQLQDLYRSPRNDEETFENEIRPAIADYLPKILGVIKEMKSKVNERTFELHLWTEDGKESNLQRFDREWDAKAEKEKDKASVKKRSKTQSTPQIDWLTASQQLLDKHHHELTSNPLRLKAKNLEDVHVPLGLIERKEKERPKFDRHQEFSPDRGSEAYQQGHTEPKRVEHDAFLSEIGKRNPGQHVVILGEPGAGKTTLLTRVWKSLLDTTNPEEQIIVAWIPLAAVENYRLEEYLHQVWLGQICEDDEIDRYWESFKSLRKAGRVWLLLDGADEMGGDGLAKIETSLKQKWAESIRTVITCRLNLWDASPTNSLERSQNFQVYRTLDFKYANPAGVDEVQDFIDKWSKEQPEDGQKLRAALDEAGKERIKDLAKNPLRLTLLCNIWNPKTGLPDTQANLYGQFVDNLYAWKADKFPDANLKPELNRAMGDLAKQGLNRAELRFRFTQAELEQFLPSLRHRKALTDLGWLNCVGVDENNRKVYAFFHPTFQEYFAACSIEDWDYFIPEDHDGSPIPCKDEKVPTYRVFEKQWHYVILLWIGRKDFDCELKEKFLNKLTSFQDEQTFCYHYRANCLAILYVSEFIDSRQSMKLKMQFISWIVSEDKNDPNKQIAHRIAKYFIESTSCIDISDCAHEILLSASQEICFLKRKYEDWKCSSAQQIRNNLKEMSDLNNQSENINIKYSNTLKMLRYSRYLSPDLIDHLWHIVKESSVHLDHGLTAYHTLLAHSANNSLIEAKELFDFKESERHKLIDEHIQAKGQKLSTGKRPNNRRKNRQKMTNDHKEKVRNLKSLFDNFNACLSQECKDDIIKLISSSNAEVFNKSIINAQKNLDLFNYLSRFVQDNKGNDESIVCKHRIIKILEKNYSDKLYISELLIELLIASTDVTKQDDLIRDLIIISAKNKNVLKNIIEYLVKASSLTSTEKTQQGYYHLIPYISQTLSYPEFYDTWYLTISDTPFDPLVVRRQLTHPNTIYIPHSTLQYLTQSHEIAQELANLICLELNPTNIPEVQTIPHLKRHLLPHSQPHHLVIIIDHPHPTTELITAISSLHTPNQIQTIWLTTAPIPNALPPTQPDLVTAIQSAIVRFTES